MGNAFNEKENNDITEILTFNITLNKKVGKEISNTRKRFKC